MLSWFLGLRIGTKLSVMTAAFLLGLVTFAAVSRDTIETVKINGAQYQRIIDGKDLIADILPPPAFAIEALTVAYRQMDALDRGDRATLDRLAASLVSLREGYATRQKFWRDHLPEGELRSAIGEADRLGLVFFHAHATNYAPALAAGDVMRTRDVFHRELLPAFEAHRAAIDKVVVIATAINENNETAAAASLRRRSTLFVAMGFGLAVCMLVLAWGTRRAIVTPLGGMVKVIEQVSEKNDLTLRFDVSGRDEVAAAGRALNGLLQKVLDMTLEARAVAEVVSGSAKEVSASAEELSNGAQHQAASLEETAASLVEITATVKQNCDNAQHVSRLADRARGVAEEGGTVVCAAAAAMGEIAASSSKITDIIGTIDEIAFQTNILALNAAVEAARAGDHGRGFAVVATEVRSLAQRSANAAREIKGLINDSTRKVDDGVEQMTRSGETLKEIVVAVNRVTDMVGAIAAASEEQTQGVSQVNIAVGQMDHVTQTNAARTEEMSATAVTLAGQADQLRALVARFKLEDQPAPAAPVRATARGGKPDGGATRTAKPPPKPLRVEPASAYRSGKTATRDAFNGP